MITSHNFIHIYYCGLYSYYIYINYDIIGVNCCYGALSDILSYIALKRSLYIP